MSTPVRLLPEAVGSFTCLLLLLLLLLLSLLLIQYYFVKPLKTASSLFREVFLFDHKDLSTPVLFSRCQNLIAGIWMDKINIKYL